jgi:hypothetical protein
MTAVIPKTGFMVICDDVELAGNEAIEAPEVPTTVELDARWDEKDGFILKVFRKADTGSKRGTDAIAGKSSKLSRAHHGRHI